MRGELDSLRKMSFAGPYSEAHEPDEFNLPSLYCPSQHVICEDNCVHIPLSDLYIFLFVVTDNAENIISE